MRTVFLISIFGFLIVSCGKEIHKSGTTPEGSNPSRGTQDGDMGDTLRNFINKQTHQCDDELNCHESVAKLVVVDRQNIKFCTATLVGRDVILTSASCLPKSLKVPGLNCHENIFTIFAETTFQEQQIVGCKMIISSDVNEDTDPALWRSDFAFIKLKKAPARKIVKISKVGLKEDTPYRSYKVDYANDYDSRQYLSYCFPVHGSYANPFSSQRYSPMITVRDCENVRGNIGAPLMDSSGSIVGVASGKLDDRVASYVTNTNLLIEKLAPLHHVANTACIKVPGQILTDQLNPECNKKINVELLDKDRVKLLLRKSIHKRNMEKVKDELERPIKYFRWQVQFFINESKKSYKPHFVKPKCFFDINTWIYEFMRWGGRIREWVSIDVEVPNYTIETKLDRKLKSVSLLTDHKTKTYKISFSPRYAYNMRNTLVRIQGNFQGQEISHRYEDVSDVCEVKH